MGGAGGTALATHKQCVHFDVTVLISAQTVDHHRTEVPRKCVWRDINGL